MRFRHGKVSVAITLFLGEYNQHHFGEWSPQPTPEVEAIGERIGSVVGEEGEFDEHGSDDDDRAHRGTPEDDVVVGKREEDYDEFEEGEEWEDNLRYGDYSDEDEGYDQWEEGSEEGEIVEVNRGDAGRRQRA